MHQMKSINNIQILHKTAELVHSGHPTTSMSGPKNIKLGFNHLPAIQDNLIALALSKAL
jgi:hypothetical protein